MSVERAATQELRATPVSTIVSLAAGGAITLCFKGSATSVQVVGAADSMSVMTVHSVD